MNKKGFTLIEIIVCIILLVLVGVGSVVGVKVNENKSNEKFYKQFDNALEIYLSDHSEIYTNLSDNVEGAVVTLEVLKNEGLIKDNIIDPSTNETLDYSNNYYVLSDAVLLENEESQENACDGQVELSVIKSWETLSGKVDTSSVLYVCPKKEKEEEKPKIEENNDDISKLEERVESLEYILSVSDLGSKNYVMFDVNQDNNKTVTWGNKDLWRIVSTNNGIKIMYDEAIKHNFDITTLSSLKSSMISSTNTSGCKYIYSTDGYTYLINSDFRSLDTSPSATCATDERTYNYVYNGNVYEDLDSRTGNSWKTIANPNTSCPDTSRKMNLYKYSNRGQIDSYIYNTCYIRTSLMDSVQNNSDIKYYKDNDLDSDYRYSPRDILNINYYSIFSFKSSEDKSIKKMVYNQINSNIKNAIVKQNYQYSYRHSNDSIFKTDSTYEDYIGTISYDEGMEMIEKDMSTFAGKRVMIGKVLDGSAISGNYYILNISGTSWSGGGRLEEQYYKTLYSSATSDFYPVVTLNKNYKLIIDINNYPESYKAACGSYELGSKDCPYLIKIGDYYSNGERVS